MIAIIRVILVIILSFGICTFGIFYCLLNPFRPGNAYVIGRLFGSMAPIFGITIEIRNALKDLLPKQYIYIANHQNNYDMVTAASAIQLDTVTIGKKSLLWIPLFGQLYWLSGNILINRNVRSTRDVLIKIIKLIKTYSISIWIFPEGTRNYGKKLLPFKMGAFYIALYTRISIVPICVSNISNDKIRLNRWSNGLVIIEVMPPIEVYQYKRDQVRTLSAYCHKIMQLKIDLLNREVLERELCKKRKT